MSRRARIAAATLALLSLLWLLALPLAASAEVLSIPRARDRAEAFAARTCAHDDSCARSGVQGCHRQSDRVVICRIYDHRKTEAQGNFLCTRLVRLGYDRRTGRVPVTGVSDWSC